MSRWWLVWDVLCVLVVAAIAGLIAMGLTAWFIHLGWV